MTRVLFRRQSIKEEVTILSGSIVNATGLLEAKINTYMKFTNSTDLLFHVGFA